jgi:hypothetical protein
MFFSPFWIYLLLGYLNYLHRVFMHQKFLEGSQLEFQLLVLKLLGASLSCASSSSSTELLQTFGLLLSWLNYYPHASLE